MIETIYSNPNLYLAHHGIKGQKWGKRNGPPYPLTPEDHSAAEKKAMNVKKAAKIVAGVAVTAGVAYMMTHQREISNTLIKHVAKRHNKRINDLIEQMGPEIIKKNSIDKTSNMSYNNKDILSLELDPSFKLSEANAPECCKNINPTHSTTNCGSCAAATIANMMGGDYQALPTVPEHMRKPGGKGYDPKKLIECFDGGKWEELGGHPPTRRKSYKDFEEKCLSYGEGAKGIFYLPQRTSYTGGSLPGHYFTFAVLNGKVKILEGQPYSGGIVWEGDDIWTNVFKHYDPNGDNVNIANLYNCPIIDGREKDLFMPKDNNRK